MAYRRFGVADLHNQPVPELGLEIARYVENCPLSHVVEASTFDVVAGDSPSQAVKSEGTDVLARIEGWAVLLDGRSRIRIALTLPSRRGAAKACRLCLVAFDSADPDATINNLPLT